MLRKYQIGSMVPLAGAEGETIEEIEAIETSQPTPIETNVSDLQEFLPSLESPLAISPNLEGPDLGDVPINNVQIPFRNDPENMDPASFFNATGKLPQQLELENLSQEEVPMERYAITNPDAPNIFRENRSQVLYNGLKVNECAMGMQYAMLSENTVNRIGHDERKALGIAGDAWNTGNNIIEKGGYRIYGLHEGTGGLSTNNLRRKLIGNRNKQDTAGIAEEMMVGDVVEMYYQDSDHQNDATATGSGGVHTTHIGMVSVDGEGNKYVTHNIGGVWHTDGVDKILNRSNGYFVSGVVRPAYTQISKGVSIGDGSLNYKRASGKTTPIERSPEEIEAWKNKMEVSGRKSRIKPFLTGLEYYAPYIQEDTGVSNEDMANLIMPVSYGLYGLESGFNNPESDFGEKAPFRNLLRGLKESGRPIAEFAGIGYIAGKLDPMSEGPTQIKLGQEFPASDQGKNFMERYGVDEETIYDPSVAASITQRLTINNMNHLKGIIGASRFDALPIETKRNLLFKAHNKGIKNLIEKDFSKKVGEDDYKLTPNSINAGLKTYSNLHIVGEEPYTNNGNDYALEINVDYNQVLAMHEESARRGYDVRPYATISETVSQKIGDEWSTVKADANSVLQEGTNQLTNAASQTQKAVTSNYTRANGELKKKILTPAEVAGERFFDEMLSIGTIAGETGENLKQELVQPVNATVEEQIKNVTKALEHDMDNFVIQSEGTLNDVKSDTAEIIARKTPVGKIVSKITEIDNAIDSIPNVITGNKTVLREFNEFMDTIPNKIPMTVQSQMLNDGRVANGEMSMEQWWQEYLSGDTPIEDELLEAAPDSVLPDLEYLQGNENIDELVSMRDGGSLPRYQEGTQSPLIAGMLPEVIVEDTRPGTERAQVGNYIDNPENAPGNIRDYIDEYNITKQNPDVVGSYGRSGILGEIPTTSLSRTFGIDTPNLIEASEGAARNIDISGKKLSFARAGEQVKGQMILGGDFIEEEPTAKFASEYKKPGSQRYGAKGKKVGLDRNEQEYYGVIDGEFKVGTEWDFKDEDIIVPVRWGGDYDRSTGERSKESPTFTRGGKGVYSNSQNAKVIVHSPSAKKTEFLFGYDKEGMFEQSQAFKEKYPDAKYVTVDTGRFDTIVDNPEGLTKDDFINYSKNSYASRPGTGYNIVYNPELRNGGYLPQYQDGTPEEVYSGGLLPEVAVSPTENYPFFGSLSKEQKDYMLNSSDTSPIMRAIQMQAKSGYGKYGQPTFSQSVENAVGGIPGAVGNQLLEAAGIPQAALVEGIKEIVPGGQRGNIRNISPGLTSAFTGDATARQELPSEYVGFKNPEGIAQYAANFGIDAVSDPSILLAEAGAFKAGRNMVRGAKKVATSLPKLSNINLKPNWAKWNKSIPDNKPLMKEYDAIEASTKADGTWMRNSDGSEFAGTPEQFIQQRSKNFKKAFPEGADITYRGQPTKAGDWDAELVFDPDNPGAAPKLAKKNAREEFKQKTFTGNQSLAEGYAAGPQKGIIKGPDTQGGGVNAFYVKKSDNAADIDLRNQEWTEIELENIKSDKDWVRHIENNIKGNTDQLLAKEKALKELQKTGSIKGRFSDWPEDELIDSLKKHKEKIKYWKGEKSRPPIKTNKVAEDMKKYFRDRISKESEGAWIKELFMDEDALKKSQALGSPGYDPGMTYTDEIMRYAVDNNIDNINLRNIWDDGYGNVRMVNNRPGNFVKSTFGNDGMFDMTNPNIFKGVAGLTGTGVALESINQD